jgi:hypothetical protein
MAGGTVTISGGNVIHTFTSSGYLTPIKYVTNSLRFRSSASAYLNRTPPVAGNRQTWTWSAWVKRGTLSSGYPVLFQGGTTSSDTGSTAIAFGADDKLYVQGYSTNWIVTNAVYRDPSAWYHIVLAMDSTQATGSNRFKLYVNGSEVSYGTYNNLTQNTNYGINQAASHVLAQSIASFGGNYFDGYMAEVQFVDGYQLTPNSFGTFNSYGVWQPITYGGSYGTNGFYLPFTNSASGSTLTANYLAVAGGGGGGSQEGGGGGAGGLLTGTISLNTNQSYPITVGAGGTASPANYTYSGGNGTDSGFSTISALGGGGGDSIGTGSGAGNSGGSGGGGKAGDVGGTGKSGQGYAGGTSVSGNSYGAGGGGGSGGLGGNGNSTTAGNGGSGTTVSAALGGGTYAGGGGGGVYLSGTVGTGTAGGGNGGTTGAGTGSAASPNTGSGGGGGTNIASGSVGGGGAGGSGVVIISYAGAQKFSGGTVTTSSGNTIHTFNTSSSLISLVNDQSPNGNNWTPNNISLSPSTIVQTFTTSGTWVAPAGVSNVDYVVVAGGGGAVAGGGGAGGFLTNSLSVTAGTSYTVTIGGGGPAGTNGVDSVFGSITATGGGKGASSGAVATTGGSGGGGYGTGAYQAGAAGTAGQGYAGSNGTTTAGGGGGGSNGNGQPPTSGAGGDGGRGASTFITGSITAYAGGGGGGGSSSGGTGYNGGGAGAVNASTAGTANTGGGGGGSYNGPAAAGGSGIVILSWQGTASTYDSMTDVPTLTSATAANYCVMNPLDKNTNITISDGNLKVTSSASTYMCRATFGVTSGKWYWEAYIAGSGGAIGIATAQASLNTYLGGDAYGYGYDGNGSKYNNNSGTSYGASWTVGDYLGFALDADAGTITCYKNNVSQGTMYSGLTSGPYFPASAGNTSTNYVFNFGQRPFSYTPPTGYVALNTYNL